MVQSDTILNVLVRTRDNIIYEGSATSVSSTNELGVFDILGRHANFISLLNNKIIVREEGGQIKEFPVDSGILKVQDNQVRIFLGVKKVG